MSKKDAVVLASRTLATLLIVWALTEVSHLPSALHSFLHYNAEVASRGTDYLRPSYLITLGFIITRIIGYSLMARWLYKGGPEIEELLLPVSEEGVVPAGIPKDDDGSNIR
jgi:ABC-type anion transport system duplicated permease subunit